MSTALQPVVDPYNNANYKNYTNSTTPNDVPGKIISSPYLFQVFAKFVLEAYERKLNNSFDILKQLYFVRPEEENSYNEGALLNILHNPKTTTAVLTTKKGDGAKVPLRPYKQIQVGPSDFLAEKSTIDNYDWNSNTNNINTTYLLNIMEGMMGMVRKETLLSIFAQMSSVNYLDHLSPADLLVAQTNMIRAIGCLNRGKHKQMELIELLSGIVRTLVGSNNVDLIFAFVSQHLQAILSNMKCWKFLTGLQLLQSNLETDTFIPYAITDESSLNDSGNMRFIRHPSIGTYNNVQESVVSKAKFRLVYLIDVEALEKVHHVYVHSAGFGFKKINLEFLNALVEASVGPFKPTDHSHIMFIQDSTIGDGNPIVLSGTSGPLGTKPLQALQGHLDISEYFNPPTKERVHETRKALRLYPYNPDGTRVLPSSYLDKFYSASTDSGKLGFEACDKRMFACYVTKDSVDALRGSVTEACDLISWSMLASHAKKPLGGLQPTTTDIVTLLTTKNQTDNTLNVLVNTAGRQGGCFLCNTSADGTNLTNYPILDTSYTVTMETIIPTLLKKNQCNVEELRMNHPKFTVLKSATYEGTVSHVNTIPHEQVLQETMIPEHENIPV